MKISLIETPRSKETIIQIKCGVHENTLPSSMPSRKWHPQTKCWRAPIVRLNIDYLRNNRELYEATDEFWDLLNNYGKRERSPEFPSEYPFKTEPKSHQLTCVKKLYPTDIGAIFADIGTGKTKMGIDIAACRYYSGNIDKVFVIALFSIKDNWKNEINIHSPIPATIHELETSKSGRNKYRNFLEEDGFRWLVVGVESLSNGSAYELCKEFVDDKTMIIIDESDSIKTSGKIRTERCIEFGKLTKYKYIMTGTPMEKGLVDLYTQFQFLDKNIIGIGDFYSFKNRYVVTGGFKNKQIIGYQRVDELLEAVNPYIYQVRKREVLHELPEATYQERIIQMSAEQKKLYNELKNTLKLEYNGNKLTVASTINLMQRFSEITGGFYSYVDHDAMSEVSIDEKVKIKYKKKYLKSNPKAKELMSLIKSMSDRESIIIWAVSKMEIAYIVDMISREYGEDSIAQMHGDISKEDRTRFLDDFQNGKRKFIVGNQAIGGIGLNMTRAAVMIYFSNDFSYRRRIQSEGRIERMGQTRPMVYIDLKCVGSIDTYVVKALKNKQDFSEAIRAAFDGGSLENLI